MGEEHVSSVIWNLSCAFKPHIVGLRLTSRWVSCNAKSFWKAFLTCRQMSLSKSSCWSSTCTLKQFLHLNDFFPPSDKCRIAGLIDIFESFLLVMLQKWWYFGCIWEAFWIIFPHSWQCFSVMCKQLWLWQIECLKLPL